MSKSISKSKPRPWIPPGKGIPQYKKPVKSQAVKSKNEEAISPKASRKMTIDIPREETVNVCKADTVSLSSHSSIEHQNELDIHHVSVLQDMKLLYVHFASLKTSYLSTHRLIDSQDIEDSSIKELFFEAEVCQKKLNELFDDLEYSVTVLENTLNENQKEVEYTTVYNCKEKLLSRLLDMYERVILIFQTVFEKQDFKEMSQLQDSLSRKLKLSEQKCISQEAVIRDLERRFSIYQSKTSAMESYKTNLECAKAELEKQLLVKESQIKYLSTELMNASGKQMKSDNEEFIEIIETIKARAHTEKTALKKALKFQKTQFKKKEEEIQKLMQDLSEQDKMKYDIAAQRDQLKVQLTVISNNIIQQKNQIEEMKIQNLKLQNEVTEKDASYKKEIVDLKNSLEEKSSELDKLSKTKTKLEETVEELERDLKKSKEQFKILKEETNRLKSVDLQKQKETDVLYEEIQHLIPLLQNTKDIFESLKSSSHVVTAPGDYSTSFAEFSNMQDEVLTVVKEIKEHFLELTNFYKSMHKEHRDVPETKDHSKRNDMEKQFKKIEQLYNAAKRENQALKQKIEELGNSSLASSAAQRTNYFSTSMSSDARKLQMELKKKNDEISRMEYDFNQKEKDFENKLKEYKDKLKKAEVDDSKMFRLEEELNSMKIELSVLKKKENEAERLLQKNEELQKSFDALSIDYESSQRYVQRLKSSYSTVFGDSPS